jgi:hypothetical protein
VDRSQAGTCPKADRVLDFLNELVHHYGLPHRIIIDFSSKFNNHQFWEYWENNEIDIRYVSVAHPLANGQDERANGMVLDALKKRLHDVANIKGGKWIKELPNALWGASYSTYQANRVVALLPGLWLRSYSTHRRDVGIPGSRTIRQRNLRRRRVDIDSLEEARYATLVQSARYLEGIRRYHDPTFKERSFNVSDLVLHHIQNTNRLHKLISPWEAPFSVSKVTGPGFYRLQTLEGDDINNLWNIDQLCRFYT